MTAVDPEGPVEERIPDPGPQHTALWVVLSRWLLGLEAWLRSHGGPHLRAGLRAFWGFVALAGVVLLIGPVINKPLTLDDITDSTSSVTDTWIARQFTVDYRIERTADGRMVVQVEEKITAAFPDGVDEPGIQRAIATNYQGHALNPDGIEATLDGEPIEVGRSEDSEQLLLTMDAPGDGGSGTSLQGDHDFVLRYTLHDLAFASTDEATGRDVDLLRWDVFGPSWPQGLAGLDVTVTLPEDVDDQLIRQPRGSLAWLIIGAGEWLDPEPVAVTGSPDDVSYRFTNEQNIPPHANAGFVMSFEQGTFEMPAPTPLFWVQTFGPLAPLALLLLTLLFALAARAVAWGDARGRPWFVAQFEPPEGVSARMSAQVLRRERSAELAAALEDAQKGGGGGGTSREKRRGRLIAAAKVAQRTGRIGDLPRALARAAAAPDLRRQLQEGLRRIPHGFVRDFFIAAPLALTVVQWGLVRQLSFQAKLSVVWWPVAFVLLSSAISIVIIAIALSARPLTRRGALLKQHLRGIDVYAERTRLLERGRSSDPLLPYAVLLAPPREASRQVVGLIEGELGEVGASRSWRTPSFLTAPRILIRLLSLLVVAGAIVAVATLPNPFQRSVDYQSYWGDIPGTLYTKVQAFDAVAELSRDDEGRARLDVTETLTVSFDAEEEGSQVPQFAQQWRNSLDGQPLGLAVDAVTIDGDDVPYTTAPDADTLLMTTQLPRVLTGSHDLRISYSLATPAVAAEDASGAVVDRVRWAALLEGWEYDTVWDDPAPSPLTIELRVPDALGAEQLTGGWITLDTDSSDEPRGWAPSVVPFGTYEPGSAATVASEESTSAQGGFTSYGLDLKEDGDSGYPFEFTVDDVGASLDFPAGTFTGPDEGALRATQLNGVVPIASVLTLAGIAVLLGLAGIVAGVRRNPRVFAVGVLRDLARWLAPATALAAFILFVWMTLDMPGDDPTFAPLGLSAVAGALAAILSLIFTRASRATPRPPAKRR
ncbi:DUF2207 domain-containing protein [Herbiconiux liukaitaii]|uniref:DUF2207 domain-containing protein n=1 Tax=Herbiconiux liukaitaii TaxID=3342799 RepID=UPI0035B8450C